MRGRVMKREVLKGVGGQMMLLYGFEFVVVEGEAMGECVLVVEGEGVQVLRELGVGVCWLERVGTGWTCYVSVP